jgi:hypothetical protein
VLILIRIHYTTTDPVKPCEAARSNNAKAGT